MKTLLIAVMALVSSAAMADVVFVQPAAQNNCKTALEKQQLRRYLGRGGVEKPACYTPGSIRATYPAVNNCKTPLQKQALRHYFSHGDQGTPACYTPNRWVGHAKSSAGCSFADKQKIRQVERNGLAKDLPSCYR